ncbi:type II secretion system protein [candidate division KSB1 bacterium]
MFNLMKNNRGFTLFQVLIAVVALGIAATVAVKVIDQGVAESRKLKSIEQVQEIQRAIFGDTRLRTQTNFGFVGDLGRLPTSLDELLYDTGDPGWNGPYVSSEFIEDLTNPLYDAWGNEFIYDNTTGQVGIDPNSTGGVVVPIPNLPEDSQENLYGRLEGIIQDKDGNRPKRGHRRHILVFLEPIYDLENMPDLVYNQTRDQMIFRLDRVWHLFHPVWNVYHHFSDERDRNRGHWHGNWTWPTADYQASYIMTTGDLFISGTTDNNLRIANVNPYYPVTIEKINIRWSRANDNEKLTSLSIGGNSVWTGEISSGTLLDIDNTDIAPGGQYSRVGFTFNQRIMLKRLYLDFHMSDGSVLEVRWPKNRRIPPPPSDEIDDHEDELDDEGNQRRFDPHFNNFWLEFIPNPVWYSEFLKVTVLIHPDRYGFYYSDEIPVGTYIITCYNDLLEKSIKSYVVIQGNQTVKKNFVFDEIFPGYRLEEEGDDPPGGGGGDDPPGGGEDMSGSFLVTGNLRINGSQDNDVTVSNSSQNALTVTKIKVKWSNSRNYERLQEIKANGNVIWSGYNKSNQDANISNGTINPGSGGVNLNFKWNRSLQGKNLELIFTFSDGSELVVDELPMQDN